MYGFVYEALKAGITENYSLQVWYTISESANTPIAFEKFSDYDEQMIFDIAEAFATQFRFTVDNSMEYFGMWYIKYLFEVWSLENLAQGPFDFFKCWNDITASKRADFPRLMRIMIRVHQENRQGYRLTAVLQSPRYGKFVLGFVNFIINYPFKRSVIAKAVDLDKVSKSKTKISMTDVVKKNVAGKDSYFHNIIIQMDNQIFFEEEIANIIKPENVQDLQKVFFDRIFPFFVYFDNTGKILRTGISMRKILPDLRGQSMESSFKFELPHDGVFEWDYLSILTDTACTLIVSVNTELIYRFHGRFVVFEECNNVLFLASPSAEMFENKSLFLSDTSIYDSARNTWLVSQLKASKVAIAYEECLKRNKLQERRSEEQEKENSTMEDLLYGIMPARVIDIIRSGDVPFSETIRKRSKVAVIFCDLCGFTKLSGTLAPMEVAQVMSSLWERFDTLTHEIDDVQKIETIGDAYVVASGVPDPCEESAVNAAIMAIAMSVSIQVVELDFLPDPLVCRIGIDIGDVVAGVIGSKNPRYSIYGNTVVNAQKLESLSKPRAVLISKPMFLALSGHREFKLREAKELDTDLQVYWLTSFYDVAVERVSNTRQANRNLARIKHHLARSKDGAQMTSTVTNSSDQSKVSLPDSSNSEEKKSSVKSHIAEIDNMIEETVNNEEDELEEVAELANIPHKPSLLSRLSSSELVRGLMSKIQRCTPSEVGPSNQAPRPSV